MTKLPLTAALALLATAQGTVSPPPRFSEYRWQRVLTLAASAPQAEQCVVLDGDLFAHAAPGLRDVRLVQDGRLLPYAVDESFDEGSDPAANDRAQYEVSAVLEARPAAWPGSTGNGAVREDHPPGAFYGSGVLPAHVPVERVRLDPAPSQPTTLTLSAAPAGDRRNREELTARLDGNHAGEAFTIGANLQEDAVVDFSVNGKQAAVRAVVLEMRRREICYQPLTSSSIRMLLGSDVAEPARYDYAAHYRPTSTPLLATMGPVQPNPGYRSPAESKPFRVTRRQRLALATGLAAAVFLLTVLPLLRRRT